MKRIVVTGLGAITPIGNDVGVFWNSLIAGTSGARKISSFNAEDLPTGIACEVLGFDPAEYMSRKMVHRTARATQFGVAVCKQALDASGLAVDDRSRDRIGVLMATGGGGITEVESTGRQLAERGWRSIGPFFVPSAMPNATSCIVSIEFGLRGPVMTNTAACASGHYSILEAFHYLRRSEADAIVAGGTEALLSPLVLAAFARMGPLSGRQDDPATATRPFSIDRDGFVAGEGAAALLVETEEHALARGATIYGEVLGGALTADAYHVTAPNPSADGATLAMERAITYSGLKPEDVDIIFTHGTGTKLNDEVEARAIRRVFGPDGLRPFVTSIKGHTGHTFGAAGAMSSVAALHALRSRTLPPTLNYTPDPELAINVVGNHPLYDQDAKTALVNAFGFGGQNVVVVFRRYEM